MEEMMRKLSILMLLAALVFSPAVSFSGDKDSWKMQNEGGFSGPVSGAMADTVVKAKELPDDAPVVLTGNIISRVAGKKHKFTFKDATGEILLDIGKKAFRGQDISPQDTVRVTGKVDKDFGEELEIDVKQLEIIRK